MSQPNVRSDGNARSEGRSSVASKSKEAAERIETSVTEGVERVRSQADDAKEKAAERIRRVASQLKTMGDSLRTDDAAAAQIAERASRSIESAADYVSTMDVRSVARDTEQLARQRPALFYGGAFLVGLAAGRFLRSSRPQGYGQARGSVDQRRFDRGRFDEDYRAESDTGSELRSGESTPQGWTSPSDEAERRNQRSQERYRQNYDTAFERDLGPERGTPRSGSSSPVTGSSTGPSRSGSAAPEGARNGFIDPMKGSGK